ncbi:MAG: HAD family phosphatase, partial [Lachnospiraceae bacterium]|nr:HAD family phosphatase [Lachnospiraceae bacterium]
MIRNIIFDIGGVLVGFDWPGYIKQYGFAPEKEAAITQALMDGPVWKELDRGIWTMEELLEGFISLAPQYREDVRRVFLNSGGCIYRQEYAIPWITSLKKRGYHVYFLSNYSEWMIEQTKDALDFLPYLDGGIFSCDVKQIKPDAAIYQSLLKKYPAIRPEESVFLDDSAANVEAAGKLGFYGIVVQDHAQADRELEKL